MNLVMWKTSTLPKMILLTKFQKALRKVQSQGLEPRSNVLQSPKVFYKVNIKHNLCFPDDVTFLKLM